MQIFFFILVQNTYITNTLGEAIDALKKKTKSEQTPPPQYFKEYS